MKIGQAIRNVICLEMNGRFRIDEEKRIEKDWYGPFVTRMVVSV